MPVDRSRLSCTGARLLAGRMRPLSASRLCRLMRGRLCCLRSTDRANQRDSEQLVHRGPIWAAPARTVAPAFVETLLVAEPLAACRSRREPHAGGRRALVSRIIKVCSRADILGRRRLSLKLCSAVTSNSWVPMVWQAPVGKSRGLFFPPEIGSKNSEGCRAVADPVLVRSSSS
jgi:hypothetical protein